MTLAATFFGGINVAADTVGKQALDAQLANTPVDMQLRDFSVDGGKSLNSSVKGCWRARSEEHTSELQSHSELVCRLLLEKKKNHSHPFSISSYPGVTT